jgi:hypothetical protein
MTQIRWSKSCGATWRAGLARAGAMATKSITRLTSPGAAAAPTQKTAMIQRVAPLVRAHRARCQ